MLREKFTEIIAEALTQGYSRGIDVFMEGLEEDMAKREVLQENSVEAVIEHLMAEAGYEVIVEDEDPE